MYMGERDGNSGQATVDQTILFRTSCSGSTTSLLFLFFFLSSLLFPYRSCSKCGDGSKSTWQFSRKTVAIQLILSHHNVVQSPLNDPINLANDIFLFYRVLSSLFFKKEMIKNIMQRWHSRPSVIGFVLISRLLNEELVFFFFLFIYYFVWSSLGNSARCR